MEISELPEPPDALPPEDSEVFKRTSVCPLDSSCPLDTELLPSVAEIEGLLSSALGELEELDSSKDREKTVGAKLKEKTRAVDNIKNPVLAISL